MQATQIDAGTNQAADVRVGLTRQAEALTVDLNTKLMKQLEQSAEPDRGPHQGGLEHRPPQLVIAVQPLFKAQRQGTETGHRMPTPRVAETLVGQPAQGQAGRRSDPRQRHWVTFQVLPNDAAESARLKAADSGEEHR